MSVQANYAEGNICRGRCATGCPELCNKALHTICHLLRSGFLDNLLFSIWLKKENHSSIQPTRVPICADASRRRLILGVGGLTLSGIGLFGLIVPAHAEAISVSTAINRAGLIRALSQQSAKAYAQVALDVLPDKGNDIIAAAQALVQRNIVQLQTVNATDAQRYLDPLVIQSNALTAAPSKANSK